MSEQYDLYLEQHRGNVAKGYRWMRERIFLRYFLIFQELLTSIRFALHMTSLKIWMMSMRHMMLIFMVKTGLTKLYRISGTHG